MRLLIALGLADNTINKITPIQQGIIVTTLSGGPLIAGQANQLNLSTGDPKAALDGAMLYAKAENIIRVGSFSDPSGTFKDFPGCGRNHQGKYAGVIHQQIISNTVSCHAPSLGDEGFLLTSLPKFFYTGLSFNVPKCDIGPITLAGLDVTDNGFGIWNVTMPVVGAVSDADDCMRSDWDSWSH